MALPTMPNAANSDLPVVLIGAGRSGTSPAAIHALQEVLAFREGAATGRRPAPWAC